MVIGIDESGSSKQGEVMYYASVLVRPSKLELIERDFLEWEKKFRKNNSIKGEIKGSYMSEEDQHLFVKKVLLGHKEDISVKLYRVYSTEEALRAAEKMKSMAISTYEDWRAELKSNQKAIEKRGPQSISRLIDWIRSNSAVSFLRLRSLGYIIGDSINDSVIVSVLDGYDGELERMRVDIDRGFIRSKKEVEWEELLRNFFIHYSVDHPMPYMDSWDDQHPFVSKFVDSHRSNGDHMVFKPSLKQSIKFYSSENRVSIRLADICANIVFRKRVKNKCDDAFDALMQITRGGITSLRFTDVYEELGNPYLTLDRSK